MHQALAIGRAVGGGAVETIVGTANQVTVTPSTGDVVISIPSTFIAPGSITATTSVTATTVFLAGNGTAAAPSYSFTTQTSLGLFKSGTNRIGLAPDGTERFTFGISGGTTNAMVIYGGGNTSYSVTHSISDSGQYIISTSLASFSLNVGGTLLNMSYNGAMSFVAAGTNQSITLTPSGTGQTILTAATGSSQLYLYAGTAGSSSQRGRFAFTDTGDNGMTISTDYSGGTANFISILPGAVQNAKFTQSGHLLLSGLPTDGIGVLQFPAATTSAGGITFGTDVNLYRLQTGRLVLDHPGGSNPVFNLYESGVQKAYFGTNSGVFQIYTSGSTNLTLGTANTTALTIDTAQNATFAKKISSYNGVSTAGWGVSTVQADGNIAGTTNGRSAAVATYTVGAADGTFVVGGAINVTTSTTFSFSLDVVYTDDGNVSRTLVLPLTQLAGTFVATGLATNVLGAGPYESAAMTIRCKASTSITIRPSAGGTYTAVVYNVAANIRQVG